MPGIGKTTAEQIVATLKNKVTRYAMASAPRTAEDGTVETGPLVDGTVFEDAYAALLTLGLSPVDARNRLDQVAASGQPCDNVEDVLTMIFRKDQR